MFKKLKEKIKALMPKKIKAFLVSFSYKEAHSKGDEVQIRNIAIVAYDNKEAHDIFVKWLLKKHIFNRVNNVVVQRLRKTRKNKHMFTKQFYNKQNNALK